MKLSLIIPAHNEENCIIQTLKDYLILLRRVVQADFEVIVVENGSTDKTYQLVLDYQKNNPEIILIKEPIAAKGRAVRLGLDRAVGEWVSFVDADNAIPPLEWEKLFKAISNNIDGAIASRFLSESKVFNRSQSRRLAGKIFSLFVRIFFAMPFKDTQCGAKIIRGLCIKKILPKLKIDNMALDVEMLWYLHKTGAKIKEIPINWSGGVKSVVGSPSKFIKQAFKMIWSLFIIRFIH